MRSHLRFTLVVSALLLWIGGCGGSAGTDSHTEVFKTADAVATDRLQKQLEAHKELAVSVLRFSRHDVEAKAAQGTTITVSADGVTQPIDLAPIEQELLHHQNEERAILRRYLDEQLRPFDLERLKILGFDRARAMAGFTLVNSHDLTDLQKQAGDSPLRSVKLVSDLYRVTVIRRADPTAAAAVIVPVTASLTEAWDASPTAVDAAAMENLRGVLSATGDNLVETLAFGIRGKSGSLKSGVDPAVIVLPEFLAAVRKAWKTQDNLVLFVPSATGISFVEEHNQKLLDTLVPQWKKILVSTPNALCDQLLLRDEEKLSLFAYQPATKPATKPAATKPEPYIVH
jgi:hypothetical protein